MENRNLGFSGEASQQTCKYVVMQRVCKQFISKLGTLITVLNKSGKRNWFNIGPSIEQNDTCLTTFSVFPISASKLYQNIVAGFGDNILGRFALSGMFLVKRRCKNSCICLDKNVNQILSTGSVECNWLV